MPLEAPKCTSKHLRPEMFLGEEPRTPLGAFALETEKAWLSHCTAPWGI